MPTLIDTINLTDFNGLKVSKLVDINAKEISKVTIEKGAKLPSHVSKTNVTLIVLEGKLDFYINDQLFELKKHQVFQFKKKLIHSVYACENSKFILVK